RGVPMVFSKRGLAWAIVGLLWSWMAAEGRAQTASTTPRGGATTATAPNPTAFANPYTSPYMNPFLNPDMMMAQPTPGRSNTLLYLWGAQQAPGGLLAPMPSARSRPAARAAEMPNSLMVPGGGASHYFQRGPVTASSARPYYQRQGRYFR